MKKTFRTLGKALLTVVLCYTTVSCGSEEIAPADDTSQEKREVYEVAFELGGDFITTSQDPLTRATSGRTLYGIEVMYKDAGSSSYSHYAEGLFDNVSDMRISLESGYQYAFYCHVLEEGNEPLYASGGVFREPFYYQKLTNKFNISTTSDSVNRDYNTTVLCYASSYYFYGYNETRSPSEEQAQSIYYGFVESYTPKAGGSVTIELQAAKKYGVKYVVNPPSDGSVSITGPQQEKPIVVDSNGNTTVKECPARYFEAYKDFYGDGAYYYTQISGSTLSNRKCFRNITDYTTDVYTTETVSIVWTRANGATKNYSQDIIVKSGTITTINVSVSAEATGESMVKVQIPQEGMTNTTADVIVSGGELVDNNVNTK